MIRDIQVIEAGFLTNLFAGYAINPETDSAKDNNGD